MKKYLLIVPLLLVCKLAVAVTAASTPTENRTAGAASSLTVAHNIAADDRLAVYGICMVFDDGAQTITGATYGGAAATLVAQVGTESASAGAIQIWRRLLPATGAQNFVLTANGNMAEIGCFVIAFSDVNQATPEDAEVEGTEATSASRSLTLGTTTNEIAIGGFYGYSGAIFTITQSDTLIEEDEAAGDESGMAAQYGTDTNLTWTLGASPAHQGLGIVINHDGGGGGSSGLLRRRRGN